MVREVKVEELVPSPQKTGLTPEQKRDLEDFLNKLDDERNAFVERKSRNFIRYGFKQWCRRGLRTGIILIILMLGASNLFAKSYSCPPERPEPESEVTVRAELSAEDISFLGVFQVYVISGDSCRQLMDQYGARDGSALVDYEDQIIYFLRLK